MSDPQIVRLKKEIELLREHNVQLKIQLEQQAEQLGQMEYQHLNIMNKNLMLQEEKKLSEDSTKLEKIISAALINEKQKTEEYRKKCEELTKEKNDYLEQIKDNEIYIQKLQQDNSRLKKDLLDFGQKHEAQDYIDKIKMKDLEIQKVIEEKADIVRDWDDLRDKMEEVLKENRVLRQIADVPENFGIDISKINLGDRIKIEDYKAKIRILQHEVDLLETERAKLKYKIEFLADSFQSKEEPFSKLNKEQKVELANFALKLYNEKDKNNIQSEKYDYIREIRKKDEIIKNLENDLSIYRAQLQNKGIPSGIGKLSHNQMDEIIQMIKENQKDVINMININKEIAQNNPKLNTTNNLNNFNEENTDKNFKLKTAQNLGKNVLLTNTSNSNININNNTINRFNNETDTNLNNNNLTNYNNNDNDIIFNLEQLPPVPIYDPHKPNNTSYAKSYKFNSKIKIDPQLLNNLFGISEDLDNSDDFKKMAIALQSQLIEMIEIESRRNDNDTKLNNNLKSLFNKYEKLAIILKQIFERYMKFKLKFEENEKALKEKLDKNNAELLVLKKVNDIYQSTIEKIEKKDLGDTEKAILEKMKQNAILESDLEKLKRKYKNLFEDEKKLREYLEMTEKYNLEKEKNMRNNITRLKDWKNILMFYLRFLNDKLKKSVDRDKFDLMVEENKYLREKNSQLTLRDIEVTKETTNNQTLLMKYKDLEDSYFNLQEAKYDIEIELNFMQKRIEELDPEYNNEQIAFRKLVNKLTALNMSFDQIKYAFATLDKNKDNNNNKSNVWDDLYFMKDLNSSNSIKDKKSFEECLRKNLGINEQEITKTDLYYIYRILNCEDEDIVDLRKFMRKLELYAISERNKKNNEFEVLEKLIKCAQDKNKSLLEAFSFFDTNNNGCITRDEFIYTLSQLGFQVSDENIDKLIFLVSGESPIDKDNNIHFLDEKDNFNYIEFCELFEKKAKNVILKNRKTTINKNRDKIDWKINLLTKIYFTLNNIHMKIDTVFDSFEKTEKGFLSLDEFSSFLIHIGMEINSDNLKKLFLSFNNDYKINREINPKNYFVKTEKIIEELNKVAIRANEYKRMTELLFSDNTKKADLNQKYNLLLEEQKYFNIRYNDLENKYNDLLKNNQLLTVQLQNYVKQNNTNIDKYFKTIEELQQLKLEYMSAGIKREDYVKLQTDNDSLFREVSLLRIGMNTFKELYNTANYQIKQMKFIEMRNLDELDTYKRAIRELQGESNQNSLIGKLYYTILICRWREASTLRKYDDALGNITQLKLDNFALETNNKNLIKDLNEIQSNLHDKIIENIKIQDSLDNYESGLFIINTDKEKVYPLEEMKKLVNMLKEDKRNNTEKLLKLRKKVLNLENDKSYLENEIEFCESLANNIRFNNRDEYSQKLISMSEDISKLKLENKKLKREYDYIKESLEYNNRINQQLNQSLTEFEKKNVSLENKYRKMEEKYQRKNEENQKKLIEGLKNLKLDKSYNLKNIPNNNINNNINNNKVESDNKNIESLMKTTMNKYELNEQKIKQLNDIITKKDKEIETLKKINEDNIQSFKREKEFAKTITTKELVGKEGYELIKNEETNMMAKTMHQTVKVLQEMLNQKSLEINEKNKIIENLHNEISKSKSIYIQQINILKNQLTDKNKTTLSELQKLIEENNAKKIVDIKKKEINNTSIIELEKLLADKENEIKALNIELDGARMENKNNINKIEQLNKKLILFEDKLHEEKLKNNSMNALNEYYNKNFIQKLEEEMHLKNEMIEREKAKINEIYKKFSSNYQDKTLLNNDPSQKNQKMAQSVQLNDQEESKEKTELKKELDKYKNKNKNLVQEIKKLKQDIEELEKSKNEISLELYKNREDKKTILDLQVKDNKKIALLNKEKEKLKKENNKIKEEFEKLKLRLTDIEKSNDNLSNINYNLEQKLKNKGTTSSVPKIEGPKIDKKNLNLNQHKQNQFSVKASSNMIKIDDILNNICKYCIIKNLNLKKHLQRYDITKNGKIGQNDFKRAIEELKIGLINYDLEKLHNACKLPDSNDVSIENFLNLLKNKNAEFKKFLDEYPDTNEIIIKQGNKQASRKYENFEGKEFNIDY
mgnify:CR=1 FL=1